MPNPNCQPGMDKIPGSGRKKGSKNQFTNLKNDFLDAFNELGGVKELVLWAKKEHNKRHFYKMIARMLPTNLQFGEGDDDWKLTIERKVITDKEGKN